MKTQLKVALIVTLFSLHDATARPLTQKDKIRKEKRDLEDLHTEFPSSSISVSILLDKALMRGNCEVIDKKFTEDINMLSKKGHANTYLATYCSLMAKKIQDTRKLAEQQLQEKPAKPEKEVKTLKTVHSQLGTVLSRIQKMQKRFDLQAKEEL